ncbi:MAG: F0F1 ATP synthase subunit delta [Candidatus Levybacteria bacterium]|nr:F0F1 ATP synthase subunit delta [Candidatus Levybacteria bacterium]
MKNTYLLKNLAKTIVQNRGISKTQSVRLTKILTPKELRQLMEIMALEDEKITMKVTSADGLSKTNKSELTSLFYGKKIETIIDNKIGAGLKVQAYDMIYDLSVKSKIEKLAEEIEEEL